jgi:hypothetical protein
MHQQIKASPDDTATNVREVVRALADAGINIEAIAPDFDPPHVRVLVKHKPKYDKDDQTDPFNVALEALRAVPGFEPTVVRSVDPIRLKNEAGALRTAMDVIENGNNPKVIDSILVLPAAQGNYAVVSIGVQGEVDQGWADEAVALSVAAEQAIWGGDEIQ